MKDTSFNPSSEYLAREKRFNDAVSLTRPDRVPIASLAGLFMARYSGLNHAEALYDYDRLAEAWKQSTKKLNWDMAPSPSMMFRQPDKLKAAMELITPFLINSALGLTQQTGNKRIFILLHRGQAASYQTSTMPSSTGRD